jgi:hypothetical protein
MIRERGCYLILILATYVLIASSILGWVGSLLVQNKRHLEDGCQYFNCSYEQIYDFNGCNVTININNTLLNCFYFKEICPLGQNTCYLPNESMCPLFGKCVNERKLNEKNIIIILIINTNVILFFLFAGLFIYELCELIRRAPYEQVRG